MLAIQSFIVACLFLTRIPIPKQLHPETISNRIHSASVLFYPVVGIVIGLALSLSLSLLTAHLPSPVVAALVLIVWCLITGALHLDGLADSIDGYFASHKNPEKSLAVFRDPNTGAMGAVGVCVILILKFSLIAGLTTGVTDSYLALVWATVLSRLGVTFYMLFTPYVRDNGTANGIDLQPFKGLLCIVLISTSLLLWHATSLPFALVVCLGVASVTYSWRRLWMKKINGYTGDCAGALIEFIEVVVLICFLWNPA